MSASGEAAIVETRRDLRLLPAVVNALAHLPPSWRINLIHGGQLSPSCVDYLGAPDRLRCAMSSASASRVTYPSAGIGVAPRPYESKVRQRWPVATTASLKTLQNSRGSDDALMQTKRRPAVPAFVWLQKECALKRETSSRSEACSRA